ncbi:MAG: ABC transporter ATP-binding protein [Bdellovibrionota bacterium]
MSLLYKLEDIEYSYVWNQQQISVLKGISLEVSRGSFTCLVGPSGVGKTTLLNLMGVIENPTKGRVHFCDELVSEMNEKDKEAIRLKNIGFVFQGFYLIPTLTALENAAYFLPSLGMNRAKADQWASEILDLLGLADQRHKKPLELSGGQRQRVAIARAMSKRPQVILADEPTANLDSVTADKIVMAFQELQRAENTSFIFATHDSHLVSYAKNVLKMKDGLIYE